MKNLQVNNRKVLSKNNRSLKNYLRELGKLKKTQGSDDKKTKEQLVQDNLLFVISVAKQYQNLGVPIEDLIAEGNLGLIDASVKFDGNRGNKFISYAVWYIRRKIINHLNKHKRIIKVSTHNIRQLEQVRIAEDSLIKKLDRLPSLDEIYVELDEKINREIITNLIELNLFTFSFDYTNDLDEENYSLEEKISNGDFEEGEENNRDLEVKRKVDVIFSFVDSRFKSKPIYKDLLLVYFGIANDRFNSMEELTKEYNLDNRQLMRYLKVVLRKIKYKFKLGYDNKLRDLL